MKSLKLIISLLIPLLIGAIGGLFTDTGIWYESLIKPAINPPGWVFGFAWTILYILMGLAFYLVWVKDLDFKIKFFYFGGLFFNLLWSFLFFYLHLVLLALFDIIVLFVFVMFNTYYFYKKDKVSGYLFIPYLLWLIFASILNVLIFVLN